MNGESIKASTITINNQDFSITDKYRPEVL